mgnify:CR=1 FL=1
MALMIDNNPSFTEQGMRPVALAVTARTEHVDGPHVGECR